MSLPEDLFMSLPEDLYPSPGRIILINAQAIENGEKLGKEDNVQGDYGHSGTGVLFQHKGETDQMPICIPH